MIVCRACRVPIAALGGCAVCEDFKRNLADDESDEDLRPGIAETAGETVGALRRILRDARTGLGSKDVATRADAEYRVLKVGNALAKVLEAARKIQTDGVAVIRQMSFTERAELFVSWYAELPPAVRASLRDRMTQFEADIARPKELS